MSILRYKQKLLANGGVLQTSSPSGGGSSGPTQTTVQNTNIPDYAQPYVSNMLNATQAQLFTQAPVSGQGGYDATGKQVSGGLYNADGTAAATNITGFQPYTPYSNDPTKYVAGFSPLQQQAQSSAANLQMPGQYGMATGLTAQAARGTGMMAGQEAMAGQNLQNTLTSPGGMAQYMNPYLQNTLAPAEQLLNQQYGIAGQQAQGQATQSGAFGGSRNALQQNLNAQNQMLAQNQLVGNAYSQAYQNAQQQAQNVASMGLQGQTAATSALGQQGNLANQLAGIGGQQLAAQQGIIGTQAAQGATEQAQQQQIINQAIQNYATAQQYPLLQLGTMSNMLRGLPMQASTTSIYQAQPTATQQAIGLGGTAAALGAAFGAGKKKGGKIKEKKMAKGGIADAIPGFKYGAVINDPKLQDDARQLGAAPSQPGQPSALQQRINDPQVTPSERILFQGVQADQNRLRQNPGAAQMLQQAGQVPQMAPPPRQQPNPAMMDQARLSGLGAAGGPAFNSQGFAGGGIIAFANEGLVPDADNQTTPAAPAAPIVPKELQAKAPKKAAPAALTTPEDFAAARDKMLAARGVTAGPTDAEKAYAEQLQTRGSDTARNRELALAIAQGFAKVGTTAAPGGLGQALNMGVQAAIPGIAKAYEAQDMAKDAAAKAASDLSEAQRKFAAGDVDEAWKDYDSYEKNKSAEKVAGIHAAAAGQTARESTALINQLVAQGHSLEDAIGIVKGYSNRADSNRLTAISKADATLNQDVSYIKLANSKKPEDQQKAQQMREAKINEYMNTLTPQQPAAAAPQASPAPDNSGIVNIPGKGSFKQLPNGNYVKVG